MQIDDRLVGVLICVLGIAVLWNSAGFPAVAGQFYGPAMFPTIIGWGFVAGGLSLLGSGLRKAGLDGFAIGFPDWRKSPRLRDPAPDVPDRRSQHSALPGYGAARHAGL